MTEQLPPLTQQQLLDNVEAIANLSLSTLPDYESDSSSDDYDVDDLDVQTILDKAGCTTQFYTVKLTPEGTVPVQLVRECLQCLFSDKLWAASLLCVAISELHPLSLIAYICYVIITKRIKQQWQECYGSESSECDSEIGSVDSSDSDSDSEGKESSDESQDEVREEDEHSCPICTD